MSYGNPTTPKHPLKSQVYKKKEEGAQPSHSEMKMIFGRDVCVTARRQVWGREGRERGRVGDGGGEGWEREVSGDGVAVTPRLSCCCPESKP